MLRFFIVNRKFEILRIINGLRAAPCQITIRSTLSATTNAHSNQLLRYMAISSAIKSSRYSRLQRTNLHTSNFPEL